MDVDWQNKFTDINQRFIYLHNSELYSDCEFIVSEKKVSFNLR